MSELGRAAAWIALLAAAGAAVAPALGRSRRAPQLLALAAAAAVVATAVLARALVTGDYSLVYVADFGRRGAGTAYRLAGLWGGMAGSLLWLATGSRPAARHPSGNSAVGSRPSRDTSPT